MLNSSTIYPELDLSLIVGKGKIMSSQDAMEDIVPVQWSDDVLDGKCQGATLIKSQKNEV